MNMKEYRIKKHLGLGYCIDWRHSTDKKWHSILKAGNGNDFSRDVRLWKREELAQRHIDKLIKIDEEMLKP